MIYNKHLDKTEEELQELQDIFSKNELDRFLDGLEAGRINTEEKVIKLTNFIRESDGLVRLELTRLKEIKTKGFIEKFATNYNKRYSTAHMLMNRAKSSISRGLKILGSFCEKKRSRRRSKGKPHVKDSSKMGKGAYTPSCWGLEQYKESVKILYSELVNFNNHLEECITLCLEMTETVKYIRSNPPVAHKIYENNRKETVLNHRSVIKRLIDMNDDMESELIEKVEKMKQMKKTAEEISAYFYHMLDCDEYNDWVISDEVLEARRQGITNQERALWGDDKWQIFRCRVAYMHIDELQPGGQKDHIGGEFIARLYLWSNTLPKRGLEYWHTHFCESYKKAGGVLTPVGVSAVKAALGKLAHETINSAEQKEFNERLDAMVDKYIDTLPAYVQLEKKQPDSDEIKEKVVIF